MISPTKVKGKVPTQKAKGLADPEDVPLVALQEEVDFKDIPLTTLEAQLLEIESENETLEQVMVHIKKELAAIQEGEGEVESMRK